MTQVLRAACCVLREPIAGEPSGHAARSTREPLGRESPNHQLLFIAYGNTLRRDDGAGLALAEKLRPLLSEQGWQVELIAIQQLTPELALAIADPALQAVCFFDTAAEAHSLEIQVRRVEAHRSAPVLGHHLIPSALLIYAKRLYGICPPAWLVTVPGYDFELGEGFSAKTAGHLADVAAVAQQVARVTGQVARI
ncbi:MAG: hydrogenase [Caldilinea sp. CFX5]|nr:hydrogenase [Caldilinea sp. CFX5]